MSPVPRHTMLFLLLCLSIPGSALAMDGEKFWEIDKFWSGSRKPMMDFSYGISTVRHKLFQGDLDQVGAVEVRLGFFKADPAIANVARLNDRDCFFNYSASDLFGRTTDAAKVKSEISRFGFGSREGYAYDFITTSLYPYTRTGLQWVKLSTGQPAGLSANDAAILDRYEGTFRFSTSAEAGLAFGIGEVVSVRGGYEVMAIYPRHVFWPWVGSYGIAAIGMGAISHFGKDIVEASPTLGPILYTLLRSGVAYGYYALVRDNQYWPFRSETPITADGFRIGLTMTF